MHRVYAEITGSPGGLRPTPLPDRDQDRPCLGEVRTPLAIGGFLAQTINLRRRNPGQPLIAGLPVFLVLPPQNPAGCRTAQRFVRFIHAGQQDHIGPRVPARKTMSPVSAYFYLALFPVLRNQPCHLRPAHPAHFHQVAPQQTFLRASLLPVPVLPQNAGHPLVNLRPALRLELPILTGFQKLPDLLQVQLLFILHPDVQYPACRLLPEVPPGSSCVRNKPSSQAHLA